MAGKKQLWEIVGGGDKGGILVKEAKELKSAEKSERLSTGAVVEEMTLEAGRLHYKKLTGTGPYTGWISTKLKDKELAVKTDKMPAGLAPPAAAKQTEQPPGQKTVIGPSGIPNKLRPATETAAKLKPVEKRIRPMMPVNGMKEKKLYFERCAKRLEGELYGLPFPQSPEEFVSPSFGVSWLTEAFHRAGTLPEDNRVSKITWWRRFPGGGSGPKTLFVVEYEKPDEELDTVLFVKQPWPIEENNMGRFQGKGLCVWGDVDGGEINFYVFVAPYIPFPVPKLYFGDCNRESTESIIINSSVDWPAKSKKEFGAYEVRPEIGKCEDFRFKDTHKFYYAMMKRMGQIAGLEKTGKLGPSLSTVEWSPTLKQFAPKQPFAQVLTSFVNDVAPQIWPEKVQSKAWQTEFEKQMNAVASISHILSELLWEDPLYCGFGHANLQTDNAYFFENSEGEMECGLYDWGQTGYHTYCNFAATGLIAGMGEMLVEHEDGLFQCFLDAYHETGAPKMEFEKMINQYYYTFAVSTEGSCGGVFPFLSEKHPAGKPFWKTIKAWTDEKIMSDFGLKFNFGILYNLIIRWSLRSDTYWESIKKTVKTDPFVQARMKKEGISAAPFA